MKHDRQACWAHRYRSQDSTKRMTDASCDTALRGLTPSIPGRMDQDSGCLRGSVSHACINQHTWYK